MKNKIALHAVLVLSLFLSFNAVGEDEPDNNESSKAEETNNTGESNNTEGGASSGEGGVVVKTDKGFTHYPDDGSGRTFFDKDGKFQSGESPTSGVFAGDCPGCPTESDGGKMPRKTDINPER